MTKPRVRKKRTEQTISATDEEWDDVRSGAVQAGMTASAWAVHCALTVDPLPRKHRRLVLDEKEQRSIPRAVGGHARSLIADIDAPSQFADDLGALLKARLETMVREGRGSEAEEILRQVLGDERAAAIAAALSAKVPAETASAQKPRKKASRKKPGRDSGQGELFSSLSGRSGERVQRRGEKTIGSTRGCLRSRQDRARNTGDASGDDP